MQEKLPFWAFYIGNPILSSVFSEPFAYAEASALHLSQVSLISGFLEAALAADLITT